MRNKHTPRFKPIKILLPCYLSAPISNANILWGGAATALLGATLAEWQRKRAEEEAARLAALRNSGGGDEGGDGGGRTNAGRKAYQAMMQEKRIVGALQAEQNAKAAQTQAASQRAKDDFRAGEKAYDIAQASTQNTGGGKPLAMPVPVENRVTDKEREEAMTAYREGERNAVSIAEEYKSQVREEANQSYREGERDAMEAVREYATQSYHEGEREAVSIAEQARLNAVDAARWAGVASVAQAKENNPPWQEKITNAVGQAWDVTKTTTISAWNLTKTIATDFGNLVVETGKSLAYSFNQTVVPKLNSVFVSTQKALLSAWDDTKNVFIGIKNDIASIPFAIKDAAKENIPIVAEWLYQNRTIPVVTFAEKHPLATKVMTHILNRGIDSEKEKMRPFTDTNPESMTWTDLGKVWLYEYGDKDTIKFDSDAALTKEVMALDGVQSYREEVISNLRDGRIEDITQKPVEYGVDQFGHSLIDALMGKSGDLFLGSYTVSIVVEPKGNGIYVLNYEVKNSSTWASATRFRDDMNNDHIHDSVVPDETPRGEGIELGGRLEEVFTWSEEIQIPNGGGK